MNRALDVAIAGTGHVVTSPFLAAGALASAFAPNITFLLACRIIIGIGIGGD